MSQGFTHVGSQARCLSVILLGCFVELGLSEKGKTGRGDRQSILLLLALAQALNPECLLVPRGHGENNMEELHEELSAFCSDQQITRLCLRMEVRFTYYGLWSFSPVQSFTSS